MADFHWQNGYGAFSISPSHVDALMQYIANQIEHHMHESFQDEFRRLCEKYGIEIDDMCGIEPRVNCQMPKAFNNKAQGRPYSGAPWVNGPQ